MKRILVATFGSALIAIMAVSLLVFVPAMFSSDKSGYGIGLAIVMAYGISIIIGLVLVGIPAHLAFSHYGITSVTPYTIIGFVVPFAVVVVLKPFGVDPPTQLAVQGAVSGIIGVTCATAFWFLAAKPNK